MTIHQDNIGFIGGGNMAEALIKGLIGRGVAPQTIWVADPSEVRQTLMRDAYGVQVTADNASVAKLCSRLVLAIKPQMVGVVVPALAGEFTPEHLLISILAGTSSAKLEALLGGSARVIRVMPNTPALVGAGASALAAGSHASAADMAFASGLFEAVGSVQQVAEAQMDAVTGLSGSGPAYIFTVIEALTAGGVREGLAPQVALALATQTVLGSARLVAETGEQPADLRAKVCSPGGTTLAGLTALDDGHFRDILMEAVSRATRRSEELGKN